MVEATIAMAQNVFIGTLERLRAAAVMKFLDVAIDPHHAVHVPPLASVLFRQTMDTLGRDGRQQ